MFVLNSRFLWEPGFNYLSPLPQMPWLMRFVSTSLPDLAINKLDRHSSNSHKVLINFGEKSAGKGLSSKTFVFFCDNVAPGSLIHAFAWKKPFFESMWTTHAALLIFSFDFQSCFKLFSPRSLYFFSSEISLFCLTCYLGNVTNVLRTIFIDFKGMILFSFDFLVLLFRMQFCWPCRNIFAQSPKRPKKQSFPYCFPFSGSSASRLCLIGHVKLLFFCAICWPALKNLIVRELYLL